LVMQSYCVCAYFSRLFGYTRGNSVRIGPQDLENRVALGIYIYILTIFGLAYATECCNAGSVHLVYRSVRFRTLEGGIDTKGLNVLDYNSVHLIEQRGCLALDTRPHLLLQAINP
jgi:hypothetical protein